MEQVREADAQAGEVAALGGREAARREARVVEQVIEAIAGVRVVVTRAPREPRRIVADEHDVEVAREDVLPSAGHGGSISGRAATAIAHRSSCLLYTSDAADE